MGGWRLLHVTVGAALLGLVASLTLVPSAQAYEDWQDWNDYTVVGLPEQILADTPFSVTVDGPVPVCSMTFGDVTLTAPPWNFVAPLDGDRWAVMANRCDGEVDRVGLYYRRAFEVNGHYLSPVVGSKKKKSVYEVRVANNLEVPATAQITDRTGRVLASQTVPPVSPDNDVYEQVIRFSPGKLTRTQVLRLTLSTADGRTMTSPLVIPVGWAVMLQGPEFPNCSTVKWFYDDRHVPKDARKIPTDIAKGLALLQARTGLTFVRTNKPDDAQLVFSWDNLGTHGPSGVGGTDGTVVFNTKDMWPEDEHAGTKFVHGYLPGRVWLIVHEVMHTMGFGHVYERGDLMYPVGYLTKFGKGDLAGLKTMYPKAACRA